jgi:hypothetical protein
MPRWRVLALQYLASISQDIPKDKNGDWLVTAIDRAAKRWRFVREPAGADFPGEVIQSPALSIANGLIGDCDDWSAFACALARVFGLRCAVGYIHTGPGHAHILPAIRPGWYDAPDRPFLIVDPDVKKPMDAALLNGAHWLEV